MPLTKSTSKKAFSKNVAAEVKAGRPLKQSLAIAYSERREAARDHPAHSRHIEELGSAYESNSVSSGREPHYHPAVMASRMETKEKE